MPPATESVLSHPEDGLMHAAAPLPDDLLDPTQDPDLQQRRRAFCTQLKVARSERGVSLDTVARATKVSRSLYDDLERGKLSRWPGGIYRRGFFREYAAAVGLPVEEKTDEFLRLFPEEIDFDIGDPGLARSPLRLTLAGAGRPHLSARRVLAAAVDVALVTLLAAAGFWMFDTTIWMAAAVAAVAYHLTGTAWLGSSPGTWWMQQRGVHRASSAVLRLAR